MEQVHGNFEFKPQNPEADIKAQKNADAFMQMAEDIENMAEAQPEQKTVNTKDSFDKIEAQKVKNSLPNIGPKYLSALESVLTIADIRSIEAQLPILKCKVEVSPLTGQEEQALRSSSVSPESFLKKLNELVYNHTTFSDREFTSFNDFLSSIYPPDKSILIWALMSASYLVLPTMEKECESCSQKYVIEGSPEELIHEDTLTKIWEHSDGPSVFTTTQYALDGQLGFEIGMPSERDRLVLAGMINPEKAKDNISKTGGLMSYADNLVFFTKAIMVGKDGDRIVLTNMQQDIYPFLHNLPPKISDAIKGSMDLSIFDEYMPKFYLDSRCDHCANQEKISIDPEIAFFRKAISL